jgi:hypothetical protein
MSIDRRRQVAFPACSARGAVGGSVPRLLPLASTEPVIRTRTPAANSISIDLQVPEGAVKACCTGATETAAKWISSSCRGAGPGPKAPERACRRQAESKLGWTLCQRANLDNTGRGRQTSFSAVVHRRRRFGPDRTVTVITFAQLLAN